MIQMVHFVYSYFRAVDHLNEIDFSNKVYFSVPTGAFGNALAGILIAKMGLPVAKVIVATNSNDILHRFFSTGELARGNVVKTIAPAIDIQMPYNFERLLFYLHEGDTELVRKDIETMEKIGKLDMRHLLSKARSFVESSPASQQEIQETILSTTQEFDYTVDPHTAVAVHASKTLLKQGTLNSKYPVVIIATAHPAKFQDTVEKILNNPLQPIPQALKDLDCKPTQCYLFSGNLEKCAQNIQYLILESTQKKKKNQQQARL